MSTQETTENEQSQQTPNNEQTWAVLTHVGTLFLSFIWPLILFFVIKSDRVRAHAREDLNLCISFAVYFVVLGIIATLMGAAGAVIAGPLFFVLAMMAVIMLIIAAVKATQGELFRHKMVFRLLN